VQNIGLYLAELDTRNCIKLAGEDIIDKDRLLGLIQSISDMGQQIVQTDIINIELQHDRTQSKKITHDGKEFILIHVSPLTEKKENSEKLFLKFFNKIFSQNQDTFFNSLTGDTENTIKAQTLSGNFFDKQVKRIYQSRIPIAANISIGVIVALMAADMIISLPMLLPEVPYDWYSNISVILSATIACIILGIVAFNYGIRTEAGIIWLLLFISSFFSILGEMSWATYDLILKVDPYPSWADLFWIIGYILLLSALILEDRAVKIPRNKVLVIIWSIIIIGATIAIYFTFVNEMLIYEDYGIPEKIISLFYIVWDMIQLFILGMIFFKYRHGSLGISWLIILIGITVRTAADITYTYMDWLEIYENNMGYNDPFFVAGYYLVAIAGFLHLKTISKSEMMNE